MLRKILSFAIFALNMMVLNGMDNSHNKILFSDRFKYYQSEIKKQAILEKRIIKSKQKKYILNEIKIVNTTPDLNTLARASELVYLCERCNDYRKFLLGSVNNHNKDKKDFESIQTAVTLLNHYESELKKARKKFLI